MATGQVTLIGGSGFIGRSVADRLTQRALRVIVPTRNRERAKESLIVLPTLDLVRADVHRNDDLAEAIDGSDAVINLVGILHASRRGSFERVHVDLPRRIVEQCRRAGVKRLLHMSALGAHADAPSAYLRSKAAGEAAVLQAAGTELAVTVFRPSVVFGAGDRFLSLFASIQKIFPVLPLGSPHAKFQPVWVEDVAAAFAAALDLHQTFGRAYELCGPKVYTLTELVQLAGALSGYPRPVIGLSQSLAHLQALAFELLPGKKLLTRDNMRSMSVDSVCGCGWPAAFRFAPSPLEAVAPGYLSEVTQRRYDSFRARARR